MQAACFSLPSSSHTQRGSDSRSTLVDPLGGKGSKAARSLQACSPRQCCIGSPIHHSTSRLQHWHLNGATLYLMALKETDSWRKTDWKGSHGALFVMALLAFVLETVQNSQVLKIHQDPSFCVLGNLQFRYSFREGSAFAGTSS